MMYVGVVAQCNPNDQVESWYDWFKDMQNQTIEMYGKPLTVAQENQVGDSIHLQLINETPLIGEHAKQRHINQMVKRISQYVERKEVRYQIHVLADRSTLNAFSIAGGHVYITEKMLEWVENDDELAFIIAHEIAHIDRKHGARKVQTSELAAALIGQYDPSFAGLASQAVLVATAPFGQIDEYEADKWGAVLANKAGFNPRKGLRFFQKMGEKEQYSMYEKIIRTHPYSVERINCLDDFLRNELGL